MTTVIARWLSIAAMNAALASPALALDEHFGDTSSGDPLTDATPAPNPALATSASVSASNPAGNSQSTPGATDPAGQINVYDDPLTFNTLSRITLKQLRVDASADQPDVVKDPFQPINRKVFAFNTKLDQYVLLPVAKAYKNKVPVPIKTTVGNFFSNLREPWNAVNHLLQGNGSSSYKSLERFTVNTLTSLGLADPATQLGIHAQGNEDFGQTLGKWGIKSGPFLMLPVFGPSTLRDSAGRIADIFGRPLYYAGQDSTYWSLIALEGVDTRASFIGVEDLVQGDQYALLRDLYLQRRQYLISGNEQGGNLDNSFGDEDASFGDDPDNSSQHTGFQNDQREEPMDHSFGDTDQNDATPSASPAPANMSTPAQPAEAVF